MWFRNPSGAEIEVNHSDTIKRLMKDPEFKVIEDPSIKKSDKKENEKNDDADAVKDDSTDEENKVEAKNDENHIGKVKSGNTKSGKGKNSPSNQG